MFGLAWLAVGWVRGGQACIFVRRWCSLAGDAEVASSRAGAGHRWVCADSATWWPHTVQSSVLVPAPKRKNVLDKSAMQSDLGRVAHPRHDNGST